MHRASERGHIEDEIAWLELKLLQRRDSPHFREDMDMVASLKRILVALRNEHRLIMDTLDHAILAIESPERIRSTPSAPRSSPRHSPLGSSANLPFAGVPIRHGSGDHLESLVRKVQVAVNAPSDPPSRNAAPAHHLYDTASSEMSLSTYNYLCKYNLLDRTPLAPISENLPPTTTTAAAAATSSPSQPSPPKFASSSLVPTHPLHQSSPPHYAAASTKILDDELIKRMPKL